MQKYMKTLTNILVLKSEEFILKTFVVNFNKQ